MYVHQYALYIFFPFEQNVYNVIHNKEGMLKLYKIIKTYLNSEWYGVRIGLHHKFLKSEKRVKKTPVEFTDGF